MEIPATSVSLLKDLSAGTAAARWTEFYRRYEPAMRAFLHGRFSSVDEDDVIQETMLALTRAMPNYHYTQDGNGHFRNYLIGIVRHKALDALRRETAQNSTKTAVLELERERKASMDHNCADDEEEAWKMAALEAALEQMLADDTIASRTREVFRHVALMHEAPENVARDFGISRNNVDQIKARMIAKLSALVSSMTAAT